MAIYHGGKHTSCLSGKLSVALNMWLMTGWEGSVPGMVAAAQVSAPSDSRMAQSTPLHKLSSFHSSSSTVHISLDFSSGILLPLWLLLCVKLSWGEMLLLGWAAVLGCDGVFPLASELPGSSWGADGNSQLLPRSHPSCLNLVSMPSSVQAWKQ